MTWGLVSTILAPAEDILRFAAHHLDHGAHRLYIYLDAENEAAYSALKSHPKIRVQTCDAAYWKRQGTRPEKHQVRQVANATHAYRRRAEVDWLVHMDVDEFLIPDSNIAETLGALPADTLSARVRPMERLAGGSDAYKAFIPPGPDRAATVDRLYPTFGRYLTGGFLSHVAGKLFVRSGLPDVTFKIHNAFRHDQQLPKAHELGTISLAHVHATSWEGWLHQYRYRLEKGSYRAELKPADKNGPTLHDFFRTLEASEGEAGLRAFYDEVIGDSPALRARLEAERLLRIAPLALDLSVARHFPGAV